MKPWLSLLLLVAALAAFPGETPGAGPSTALAQEEPPASPPHQTGERRDRHGPADINRYIKSLESPERRQTEDPDQVIAQLGLKPDDWIVDLGCGPGFYTLPLARAVPEGLVFALDIEPRQLDRLNEHLAEEKLCNVIPVLTPAAVPRAPLGRARRVMMVNTYHHRDNR
ncbi:MAG: methyltransferase domain-containing protein, partial [Planctomycetota bacterium]